MGAMDDLKNHTDPAIHSEGLYYISDELAASLDDSVITTEQMVLNLEALIAKLKEKEKTTC